MVTINPLRIVVVGPLPPPSGGMANQTQELVRRLGEEGVAVEVVQANAAYRPAWVARVWAVRALFRLVPYLRALWRAAGRARLMHVMANSGWAWHLLAAPAVWIGHWRGIAVVVTYHGGQAEAFFARSLRWVQPTLRRADAVVVPSGFLRDIFARHGVYAHVVHNVIDVQRFTAAPRCGGYAQPHVIVTRHLEPIYDVSTAIRAFARVLAVSPGARLTIAGTGPCRSALAGLVVQLGIGHAVRFTGDLDNDRIVGLYREADLMLNASRADNMPISVLEALASGVPVVSTRVGGIPYLVEDGRTALLVPPGDERAMADAALRVLTDDQLRQRLREAGARRVQQFAWNRVREQLFRVYRRAARGRLRTG